VVVYLEIVYSIL